MDKDGSGMRGGRRTETINGTQVEISSPSDIVGVGCEGLEAVEEDTKTDLRGGGTQRVVKWEEKTFRSGKCVFSKGLSSVKSLCENVQAMNELSETVGVDGE